MNAPLSAGSSTGSIYDLGYRAYEGPRLGRIHAIRSLFTHSLRSSYGLGRGAKAKIAPFGLGVLAVLPAIAIVGALTLATRFGIGRRFQDLDIISYGAYFGTISTIVILFCAAQAPELFGRDQRHGVLPLYFARALRRSDYALARIAGFIAALLILSLAPMVILFLGRVLLSPDVVGGIVKDLPSIPPILAQAFLTAGLLGSLSMLVAAFSPRRAYATAGIIALFVIPSILAQVVGQLGSSAIGNILTLASPTSVLDGTNAILFNASLGPGFFFIDVPSWSYFATAGVGIVGAIAITVRRFLRIAT